MYGQSHSVLYMLVKPAKGQVKKWQKKGRKSKTKTKNKRKNKNNRKTKTVSKLTTRDKEK